MQRKTKRAQSAFSVLSKASGERLEVSGFELKKKIAMSEP